MLLHDKLLQGCYPSVLTNDIPKSSSSHHIGQLWCHPLVIVTSIVSEEEPVTKHEAVELLANDAAKGRTHHPTR